MFSTVRAVAPCAFITTCPMYALTPWGLQGKNIHNHHNYQAVSWLIDSDKPWGAEGQHFEGYSTVDRRQKLNSELTPSLSPIPTNSNDFSITSASLYIPSEMTTLQLHAEIYQGKDNKFTSIPIVISGPNLSHSFAALIAAVICQRHNHASSLCEMWTQNSRRRNR